MRVRRTSQADQSFVPPFNQYDIGIIFCQVNSRRPRPKAFSQWGHTRCEECSQVRSYPYKPASWLRSTKISASDSPSKCCSKFAEFAPSHGGNHRMRQSSFMGRRRRIITALDQLGHFTPLIPQLKRRLEEVSRKGGPSRSPLVPQHSRRRAWQAMQEHHRRSMRGFPAKSLRLAQPFDSRRGVVRNSECIRFA